MSNYEDLKKNFLDAQKSWRGAWLKLKKSASFNPDIEWEKLSKIGIQLILDSNPNFPKRLKEIPWPPFGLYIKGNFSVLDDTVIAIVGTRKATLEGKNIAKKFSRELTEMGIIVASGLAFGIDAAAHEEVIESNGRTLAVLANGLDQVYPRHHENLAKKIISLGGALISEYPIGAPSLPHRFIERNRIISGLSLGIILIEAPEESGSLTTARFAMEQNREIFVVPGPINHSNYVGSHGLIKAGAALITSINDVIINLNLEKLITYVRSEKEAATFNQLDEKQKTVINALKTLGTKAGIDKIAESARLNIPETTRALTFLSIKGTIKEDNGKYYI